MALAVVVAAREAALTLLGRNPFSGRMAGPGHSGLTIAQGALQVCRVTAWLVSWVLENGFKPHASIVA